MFHYIEFPDRELMARDRRACTTPTSTTQLLDQALEVFFGLRAHAELRKKPSTSELIDWICALQRAGVDLARSGGIPFLGTLLKTEQDVDALTEYDKRKGSFPNKWADLGPRYNQ